MQKPQALAVDDADVARIKKRFDADLAAGKYPSVAAYKKAKARALRKVGTPIPSFQIALAVRTHGRLGLRALDVAASRTLSPRIHVPVRRSGERAPRGRRRTCRARARSPGRPPPGDSDPDQLVRCLARFRAGTSSCKRTRRLGVASSRGWSEGRRGGRSAT
jgi:hypothetical protein